MSPLRIPKLLRFLAPLLFIAAGFGWGLQGALEYLALMPRDSIRVDTDTVLLADAVAAHPRLAQTWDWWTGPWLAKVPYFRPLTMMGFWAQYQLFGDRNLLAFEALHWTYHGLALVLLFGFFSQIAGRGRAALAVGLFAAGANSYALQVTGVDAFNCWKDSADVWHLGFFTLSAWAFLVFLRRDKRKYLVYSLVFWFCAVAVKESGYSLPFLLPLLLWHEKKWRTHWQWAFIFFVLAPLLWAYRWQVMGGWGHRTGSNGAWLHRVLVDAVGLPGDLANGDTLSLAVVLCALFLVWIWRIRECGDRRKWPLALLGAAILACLWQAPRFIQSSLFDTLAVLGLARTWPFIGFCAATLALYAQFALRRDRAQLFAAGWILVTFIPLTTQPPTSSHVHYPVAPGWSLFLACAIWALPASLSRLAKWLQPVPQTAFPTEREDLKAA